MDANGTRFHLLLGKDDWASCIVSDGTTILRQLWDVSPPAQDTADVYWDATRAELTLRPQLFRFLSKDNPLPLEKRRGAARDRYGNWYWIDESENELRVNSVGTGNTSHFWSPADETGCEPSVRFGGFQAQGPPTPKTFSRLSGLAVTEDHYLVVGTIEPAGLLIFDLYTGKEPQQLLWPADVPFVPFDMAPMPGGGVWILDRKYARYWALDRHFQVISKGQQTKTLLPAVIDTFQPTDGSSTRQTPAQIFPTGITLSAASPVAANDVVAIEALPDCTVLLLDSNPGESFSVVYRYRFDQQLGNFASTQSMRDLIEEDQRAQFRLHGYDFAFVPEHQESDGPVADRLYIVADNGEQTYAFEIAQQNDQLSLTPVAEYFPMRRFAGRGLVTADYQAYYDIADNWIPLIKQRRPRYTAEATLYTPIGEPRHAFDGKVPDCVWHRLMLDACIPADTQVVIESRAANNENALASTDWQPEPQLYLRGDGSELPFVRSAAGTGGRTGSGYGTWELLFQNARGRYLQLKIILLGNERVTPHLQALRIYYPRFSYLERYLPAVYRDDAQSASFLDRFLANLEGFYTSLEDKIAAVQMLFDINSMPDDALEWLASWFGMAFDPIWDTRKQRLFLKYAMYFFQYRGTICGLRMALRLALEDCPEGPDEMIFTDCQNEQRGGIRIIEKYLTRRTPGVIFGDPTDNSGLRILPQSARWLPTQGSADLQRRYSDFLHLQGLPSTDFPLAAPADANLRAIWQRFSLDTLGFIPQVNLADSQAWSTFLSNRYRTIEALSNSYQTPYATFEQVSQVDHLPSDSEQARLLDWYQFQGVVLPMRQSAHQFTVLLPTPNTMDVSERQRRLDIATRIIQLEKPAHTSFSVKFYWSLFRIGEARLGLDSLLGQGSRAPQLLPPLTLDKEYLAESYLAPGYRQDSTGRQLLGRERLNQSYSLD